MKRIIETKEADGLEKYLGEWVQVWCFNYIYAGRLIGVNDNDICLKECQVVYETGSFEEIGFKDAQKIGSDEHFVRTAAIESYGPCEEIK